MKPAGARTKETEIHNLEWKKKKKTMEEDLDVGMSRKGFNKTIRNIFKDLKEEADM